MKKNGRTLLEDLKLIKRGMKEFGTFLPGQLRLLFIYSAITSQTESDAKASCHSATPAMPYLLMILSFTRMESSSSIHT